jgi:hypothetical protein
LHVIDTANPANPQWVSTMDVLEGAVDVAATRHHVYLPTLLVGLQVVDVCDPSHPRNIGCADMPHYPSGVAVSESHVFVVDQDGCGDDSCLRIFPLQCEPSVTPGRNGPIALSRLHPSAFPNPSRGRTSVRLFVQAPGSVRASIYDVSGRCIRSLHDGILPRGPLELYWDGRDREGRRVAPGIYWIRVATADGSRTERLVVLR